MCKLYERSLLVMLAALALTSSAAAWEAIRWGGTGGDWVPLQDSIIRINAPGVYKFYATTGGAAGALAEINGVDVDPAIPAGLVKVSIVRDPAYGGGPGCTDLGGIDLSAASQSEIPELRVQNDAATLSNITFQKLSGPFAVGGSIVNPVTINTSFGGALSCASLGDFTALSAGSSPSINVTNSYAGTMTITGSTTVSSLTLGGLSGSVTCNPNVGADGVTISGDVSGTLDQMGFSHSCLRGVTDSAGR